MIWKVSRRSETPLKFLKTKVGFPSNSETLKEYATVTKSENQKDFRIFLGFPNAPKPFWLGFLGNLFFRVIESRILILAKQLEKYFS